MKIFAGLSEDLISFVYTRSELHKLLNRLSRALSDALDEGELANVQLIAVVAVQFKDACDALTKAGGNTKEYTINAPLPRAHMFLKAHTTTHKMAAEAVDYIGPM